MLQDGIQIAHLLLFCTPTVRETEILGGPFYADLNELLAAPEIEEVVGDAPSNMREDVIITATRAEHVKKMCLNLF